MTAAPAIADIYALAPMQQGMLFHTLYAPASGVYVEQMSCTLRGRFNPDAFRRAWANIADRHAALRTAFLWEEADLPVQVVFRSIELPWQTLDLRNLMPHEQSQRVEAILRADRLRGFDLAAAPLMRFTLITLADDTVQFLWSFHHLLLDGWSVAIVLNELFEIYAAICRGQTPHLPPLPPYRDFIAWLAQQNPAAAQTFWRERLADFARPTPLPFRLPATGALDHCFDTVERVIDAQSSRAIQQALRDQQLTLSTLVHGAWALLLARYSGQRDVCFGTVVAGRHHSLPGADRMIGLLVNTCPVRVAFDPQQLTGRWLHDLQNREAVARAFEWVSLVDLLGWSELPRDTPLFESIVAVENYPNNFDQLEHANDLRVTDVRSIESTNYPLTLTVEANAQIRLRLLFDQGQIERDGATRLLEDVEFLIHGLIADPGRPISAVPILRPDERRKLLLDWNDTAASYPDDCGIHDLVSRQAKLAPPAVALIEGTREITYAELEQQANELANYLGRQSIGRGDRVGLFFERSVELMVSILAVLKIGAACVPLDPAYPHARLSFMLNDAAARAVLTQRDLVDRLPPTDISVVCFEDARNVSADRPRQAAQPDDIAYILYTSGSTGTPRGVAMPHRALCNLVTWQLQASAGVGEQRTLQFAPISFDVSFQEIFATWAAGGTLVLIAEEARRDPEQLHDFLATQNITRLFLPFVALQQLAQAACDVDRVRTLKLRQVITAGEQLQVSPQVVKLFEGLPDCVLHNQYGPTETHVVTAYALTSPPSSWPALPPIGRPIANVHAYVLDPELEPVPIGARGELYLGGVALARDYLNQPQLTAERFVPDPFTDTPGARLYRTGDRARWRIDRNLEFLGRVDNQVKLRGYRVEPGEVETVLLAHPAVCQAAVIVQADKGRLVGYVVTNAPLPDAATQLRAFLLERLPEYMVPYDFVALPSLPLTPSGKLDRRALPEPVCKVSQNQACTLTPTQDLLVQIWSQVLKVEAIGVHDDFFELGGHSLLATQVLSRIGQTFPVKLPLRCLFEARTIARLAEMIDAARLVGQGHPAPPFQPAPRDQPLPLSFAQERMWFLDQLEPGSAEYNLPIFLRMTGTLCQSALESSLRDLVSRHESLRTTFSAQHGRPFQVIHPDSRWPIEVVQASSEEALQRAQDFAIRPFDLSTGPLGRILVARISAHEHLFVLVLHHIITDGWSLGILVRELTVLYDAHATSVPPLLPAQSVQYVDFAAWQRHSPPSHQLEFWKQQLSDLPRPLMLPTDRRRAIANHPLGASERLHVGAELTAKIKALSNEARATLFMTLLAAFQVLLHRITGESDILVGTPVANRTRLELEDVVGCFINPVVIRTRFHKRQQCFGELLEQVRETTLKAFENQEIPFEQVVQAVGLPRDVSRNPLFQVMFIFQNAPLPPLELPGLMLTPVELGGGSAGFDLMLTMWEQGSELCGVMEYRGDLFETATVRRLLSQFELLLEGIVSDPQHLISKLPMIGIEERELLLAWGRPTGRRGDHLCVDEMVRAQVARTPDAVAVVDGGRSLTYAELEGRANQLATWLVQRGIARGDRVGLLLERSAELIISLLGVLKAGAAYVPIDPGLPPERIRFMTQDAGVKLALTREWRCDEGGARLESPVRADDLAYVLYTSGSTGKPKGVEIPHRALAHFVTWAAEAYAISSADRVLQFASISFDTSVEEIYPVLIRGATVVLRTEEMLGSAARFFSGVELEGVTVLDLPTAYWHTLTAEMAAHRLALPACVRLVILGGEQARPEILAKWIELVGSGVRLVNTYGPTEGTVVSTMADLSGLTSSEVIAREVPIGRPIAGVEAYVLDADRQPVPIGAAGELYLGGAGVARGYLNLPELTAERFLQNPFSDCADSRLYRTGDRARWRNDGNLEFLGRVDDQVKLRGYRIEPGEVETALLAHPAVRQAAVVADDGRLLAFIVTGGAIDDVNAELRAFVAARLPAYMIPSGFVTMDALPMTASGKVDRRGLSDAKITTTKPDVYAAPRSETEHTVAAIWAEVLGLERVGVHDSFFQLGGHSLLAAQLLARIEGRFAKPLSLRRLFESPTVAGISAAINSAGDGEPVADVLRLQADARLDPSIRPATAAPDGEARCIFLTGATGFLGTSLLGELLRASGAQVHGLVRARDERHGLERLRGALEAFSLWDESFACRIVAVPGDLAKPLLGLPVEQFERLSTQIDAIYHCGATVSAVQPYAALRDVNVLGTQEVLRLACCGRAKTLHHISTLAVWASPAYVSMGEICEEMDASDCGGLAGGYTQSKWVAERLVLAARERGLAVCVYRPGLVTGHSVTGRCKADDLTLAAARVCIERKILPAVDASLDLLPVDYVVRAIVHLSRRAESRGRNFHLFNHQPMSWGRFGEWLRGEGYELRMVDAEEIRAEVEELAPLRMLFGDGEGRSSPRLDDGNSREGLRDTSIRCPAVDEVLLRNYLRYFTGSGLIEIATGKPESLPVPPS